MSALRLEKDDGDLRGPANREAANCGALTLATAIRLFCLNGDLLGEIA